MKLDFAFGLALSALSFIFMPSCKSSGGHKAVAEVTPGPELVTTPLSEAQNAVAPSQGKVKIIVSVDWEGQALIEDSLEEMKKFRKDYPEIPLQHFLNAAYYTKNFVDPVKVTKLINSVILPIDEQGLHIHTWRSLVKAAGVGFRTTPSYAEEDVEVARDCDQDCGNDIALSSYEETEIRKLIAFSVNTLTDHGFQKPRSFRAGGWLADHKVLRSLALEGFTQDCSATYAGYVSGFGSLSLESMLRELWPSITSLSQPYNIRFPTGETIVELPNNGSLADYMYPDDTMASFKKVANLLERNPNQDVYISIGFHQETALYTLERFRTGIDQIKAYAAKNNIPIQWTLLKLAP